MKILKLVMLIVIIISTAKAGNKPIFQIKPEDIDYLRYFYFFNLFDSAKVVYKFGEVKVKYGNNTMLINLVHSLDTVEGKSKFGTSSQGVSSDLEDYAKTENFVIPNTGSPKITFFRGINESGNPCDTNSANPGGGKGIWDIVDRTDFVVQMVKPNTGEVVAVLDSVVSMPNSNPEADSIFGLNPHIVFHDWLVPPSLYDSTVFLRVSPRRYGPTPLGLIIKENDLWADYESLVDSSGLYLGKENMNYLDSLYWIEFKTYFDSVFSATGRFPQGSFRIPRNYDDEYKEFYNSKLNKEIFNGDTIYSNTFYNPESYPQNKNTKFELDTNAPGTSFKFMKNIITEDTTQIEINSVDATFCKILLYNSEIKKEIEIWKGGINKGINVITLDLSKIPKGSYSVILKNKNNSSSIMDGRIRIKR